MNVLVIDVGGTHVKMLATGVDESRKFESGPEFTPEQLVVEVKARTADWQYDAISLGVPGLVDHRGPSDEPGNLGPGWVGFDFATALTHPVRVVNDAAMQALGGYDGGRMLFLGLGTGLGSTLIVDRVIVPLELGNLKFNRRENLFDRLGRHGFKRLGRRRWEATVHEAVATLRESFAADYVLLGGGQVDRLKRIPRGARRGGNADAFTGGFRLWEEWIEPHDRRPSTAYRVVA